MPSREPDEVGRVHGIEPSRVECDLRLLGVQDFEDLIFVGPGVVFNLFTRQRRASRILARRITDHPREVADQENHMMAELLKLAHLVEQHGMPKMQVGCGRVEAGLYTQDRARAERARELFFDQKLVTTAFDYFEL